MSTNPHNKMLAEKRTMIYIGNLNYRMEEDDICNLFLNFGPVSSIKILPNDDGGKKGIAFIEMKNGLQAAKAIKFLNGKVVAGRTLKVSVANNRFARTDSTPMQIKPIEVEVESKLKIKKEKKKNTQSGLDFLFDNLRKLKASQ